MTTLLIGLLVMGVILLVGLVDYWLHREEFQRHLKDEELRRSKEET
jgi:type III secretory pathway component EscU